MEQLLVLKDLAVIFAVSLLVILVFHQVKLPALPGFIVAGVLLGPNALGLVSDVHRVEGLAEVGVVLLLFTIGIEFSLNRLREMGRQVLVGGGLQVGLTVAVAALVAAALGLPWQVALFLGCLIALSSTALVLKGLTDKGEIDAPHGRLATGVLIFQDLCVVPIMLALPFLAGRATGGAAQLALALGKAALIVVGVTILARTIVPRLLAEILKTRSRELVLIAIILLGTLTALGTAEAGASLALGAFLAGLVISESDYGHQPWPNCYRSGMCSSHCSSWQSACLCRSTSSASTPFGRWAECSWCWAARLWSRQSVRPCSATRDGLRCSPGWRSRRSASFPSSSRGKAAA